MSVVVNIIQMHLVSILCMILTFNPILDFILHTVISIVCALQVDKIYNIVEKYEPEFITLTKYLIRNYSFNNYRYWKRIVVLTVCGYICIVLWRVQVTSQMLFFYIIQYGICFTIVDQFEEQRIQRWVKEWAERPTVKGDGDAIRNMLIESYMSPKTNILQRDIPSRDNFIFLPNSSPLHINSVKNLHIPTFNEGLVKPINNMKKSRIFKKKRQ